MQAEATELPYAERLSFLPDCQLINQQDPANFSNERKGFTFSAMELMG